MGDFAQRRPPVAFRSSHHTTSGDGTKIAWFSAEPGDPARAAGAPTLIVLGSVGAALESFAPLVDHLGERRRFIGFDYRGSGASAKPARGDVSIERHVEDLEAVLRASGTERATLIGWGVGAQVALTACSVAPERYAGLVMVSPLAGSPRALAPLLKVARKLPGAVERTLRKASFAKGAGALRGLGLLRPSVPSDQFAELYAPMAALDVDWMWAMRDAAYHHDVARLLGQVETPTLIIAGDRDMLAPYGYAQQMVRRLPRAEILVARGGTHFALLEYPELIALRVEQFLREREEPVAAPSDPV